MVMLPYKHPFVQSPLQDRIAQEIKMTISAAEGTSAIHFGLLFTGRIILVLLVGVCQGSPGRYNVVPHYTTLVDLHNGY